MFSAQMLNEAFAETMVDSMSEVLVPEDPDELRDAYIVLLAQSMARQASDDLVRTALRQRLGEEDRG